MTTTAQYASIPLIGSGQVSTADTSYTAPTNVAVICIAGVNGCRIDQIDNITQGTSVAGIHRLWLCEGTQGVTISSITFSTTTATVTTSSNHGLSTGAMVSVFGALPVDYNVKNVAITVTSTTVFTYTMSTTPTTNATTVGQYASTPATAIYHLLQETTITAITGSTIVQAFNYSLSTKSGSVVMPIVLPPGWSLRTSVTVAQTNALQTNARGGQF